MKVLVAIADFGGRGTLPKVKESFLSQEFDVKVFSTVKGDFLFPTSIGEDLPFQHRSYFAQQLENYDYFFFTENDIFYPKEAIDYAIKNCMTFGALRPIGFLRSESEQLIDVAASLPWGKAPVTKRAHEFVLSNDHQGSYLLSKAQLRHVIGSGHYLIDAGARFGYGKLETAASNVYFQCGLSKVFPRNDWKKLIVPHLDPKWASLQQKFTIEDLEKTLR